MLFRGLTEQQVIYHNSRESRIIIQYKSKFKILNNVYSFLLLLDMCFYIITSVFRVVRQFECMKNMQPKNMKIMKEKSQGM